MKAERIQVLWADFIRDERADERRVTVERIRQEYSRGIIRPEMAEKDRVLAILEAAKR